MMLGYRIRFLRLKKGLTQEKLAEKIKVTKSAISYYENNTRIPTVSNLHLLAEELGVSFDYLMGNDEFEVVDDEEGSNGVFLSKEEVMLVKLLRNKPKTYNRIIESPKRFVEFVEKNF